MSYYVRHFGPVAWLVKTTDLYDFLSLVYTDYFGEIWLYNNDLNVIQYQESFRQLYQEGIAGRFFDNVDAVKILVRPEVAPQVFPTFQGTIRDRLLQIGQLPRGRERLATFYFGVAENDAVPKDFKDTSDTWVFYTRGGHLDANAGVVMVRHSHFPFTGQGADKRFVAAWMLKDHPELQRILRDAFHPCFQNNDNFRWVDLNEHTNELNLRRPPSPEGEVRKNKRRLPSPQPLALGDHVDVAIVAALNEEMDAFVEQLKELHQEPRRTPMRLDLYDHVALNTSSGWKTILLVSLHNDQGILAAAVKTWDAIQRWDPKHVILMGVAGGAPIPAPRRDTRHKRQSSSPPETAASPDLGDIIVASAVRGYEHARIEDGEYKRSTTRWVADDALLNAALNAHRKKWPKAIGMPRPEGLDRPPHVCFDVEVASGSKLVADSEFFIKELLPLGLKVAATEMEGDGVGYACALSNRHMLLVKAIMDRSDKQSRSTGLKPQWKKYAAYAAAQFVIDLLHEL